jgi:hypothetical protein
MLWLTRMQSRGTIWVRLSDFSNEVVFFQRVGHFIAERELFEGQPSDRKYESRPLRAVDSSVSRYRC